MDGIERQGAEWCDGQEAGGSCNVFCPSTHSLHAHQPLMSLYGRPVVGL